MRVTRGPPRAMIFSHCSWAIWPEPDTTTPYLLGCAPRCGASLLRSIAAVPGGFGPEEAAAQGWALAAAPCTWVVAAWVARWCGYAIPWASRASATLTRPARPSPARSRQARRPAGRGTHGSWIGCMRCPELMGSCLPAPAEAHAVLAQLQARQLSLRRWPPCRARIRCGLGEAHAWL